MGSRGGGEEGECLEIREDVVSTGCTSQCSYGCLPQSDFRRLWEKAREVTGDWKAFMGLLMEQGATRSRRAVASSIIGGGDEWRAPIGALDINQKRIHQSLELTNRALGMERGATQGPGEWVEKLGTEVGE